MFVLVMVVATVALTVLVTAEGIIVSVEVIVALTDNVLVFGVAATVIVFVFVLYAVEVD
jgi:hypothetical protein